MNDQAQQDANKQLREDTERYRAFKDLVNTKGWKLFQDLINANVHGRTLTLFEEPTSDVRKDDHNKGACYGLLWARDIVQTTINAFDRASDPATEEENK